MWWIIKQTTIKQTETVGKLKPCTVDKLKPCTVDKLKPCTVDDEQVHSVHNKQHKQKLNILTLILTSNLKTQP